MAMDDLIIEFVWSTVIENMYLTRKQHLTIVYYTSTAVGIPGTSFWETLFFFFFTWTWTGVFLATWTWIGDLLPILCVSMSRSENSLYLKSLDFNLKQSGRGWRELEFRFVQDTRASKITRIDWNKKLFNSYEILRWITCYQQGDSLLRGGCRTPSLVFESRRKRGLARGNDIWIRMFDKISKLHTSIVPWN